MPTGANRPGVSRHPNQVDTGESDGRESGRGGSRKNALSSRGQREGGETGQGEGGRELALPDVANLIVSDVKVSNPRN